MAFFGLHQFFNPIRQFFIYTFIVICSPTGSGKTVLLELGVGFNTPGIIRYPFERMIYQNQAQILIRINKNHSDGPEENRNKTISFSEEMKLVITDLKESNNARHLEPVARVF